MKFKESIDLGYVRKVRANKKISKDKYNSALDTLKTIDEIKISEHSANMIYRESYESLRQLCESIGAIYGFKFESHESIKYFLDEILNESNLAKKFDRFRRIRNDINYRGKAVNLETAKKAKEEIKEIIEKLKVHFLL